MRTIIISDTHLSSRVYRKKYYYLLNVIRSADKVIILGDFWDGFLTDFNGFLASRWRDLFPLLRERQAVYLYGNHDRAEWSDERASLFSARQGKALELEVDGYPLYLTHGHTIFTSLEDQFPALQHSIPLRIGSTLDVLHKLVWGRRFLAKDSDINDPMREWASQSLDAPEILVAGHSHYPELDLGQRIVNPGFIGCGYGNYVAIENGKMRLVKERY